MKAVVVGSGGWGTALALVLCDNGHDVKNVLPFSHMECLRQFAIYAFLQGAK